MFKEKIIFDLKHDLATVFEVGKQVNNKNKSINDKFQKIPDSILNYIYSKIKDQVNIPKNKFISFFRKNVRIREESFDDMAVVVLLFSKFVVDRKNRFVTGVSFLSPEDKKDGTKGLLIALNRAIESESFKKNINTIEIVIEYRKILKKLGCDKVNPNPERDITNPFYSDNPYHPCPFQDEDTYYYITYNSTNTSSDDWFIVMDTTTKAWGL